MASEIIINPAKDNTGLTKTDGTTISLNNKNIDKSPFEGKSLNNRSIDLNNKDINRIIGSPFEGKSLREYRDDGKSILGQDIKWGHDNIRNEARGYFTKKTEEFKQFAVGDKAEWGKYWEIALGRSVTNLALEFHFDKQLWGAVDWETAFGPELEDTGFAEKLFLQGASIVADLPTLAIGGYLTRGIPIAGAAAYGAGFLTQGLRSTYLKALQEGNINTFPEWWDIFIDEGIKEGHRMGITLAVTFALPKIFQLDELYALGVLTKAQHYVANVLTQWSAFQGMGRYFSGEFADGEQMAIDGILFGGFGFAQSAQTAITMKAIKENISKLKVIKDAEKTHKDAEILYSKNQDSFVRTNEGKIVVEPIEYISVELMQESIKNKLPFLNKKIEWRTIAGKAKEKEREIKRKELDDKLDILDRKIARDVIVETEARKQMADINNKFELLKEDKRLSLSIEGIDLEVDSTKSQTHQKAEARINKKIVDKDLDILSETPFKDYIDRIIINWVDSLLPTKKYGHKREKVSWYTIKGRDQGPLTPYEMNRMLTSLPRMAESFINQGPLLSTTSGARGKSYYKIFEDNFKTFRDLLDTRNLMYSRRVVELYERNIKSRYQFTKQEYDDAKVIIKEALPNTIKAANEIGTFNKQVLRWVHENKYISKELYAILVEAGKDYVPIAREGKEISSNPFFKLRGSRRKIIDPLTTIPVNTVKLVSRVYRNNMLREFFESFILNPETMPKNWEIIKPKIVKTTIARKEIARVLNLNTEKLSDLQLTEIYYQFFKPEYNFRENNTIFFKDRSGKTIGIKVPEDLYQSLHNQNPGLANNIMKSTIFSAPTKMAKNTITLALPFFVRNITRDTKVSAVLSKNWNYIPLYQMMRGIFLTYGRKPFSFKEDPLKILETYVGMGGFESQFFKTQTKYGNKKVQKILRSRDIYGQLVPKQGLLSKTQAFFMKIAETSEVAAKLADVELTVKNLMRDRALGKNNMTDQQIYARGVYDGKNLIDFSKAGLKAEMWNNASMFFNAKIRGLDKIYEAYTERPWSTFVKSVVWTSAPYLIVYLLNHIDDAAKEAYDALPTWRKDTGYNIPVGDGSYLYIPGEWEHFEFYGAGLGAWLDYRRERDPDALKEYYKQVAMKFVLTNTSALMPDVARMLFLEQIAGYDPWYGQPIIHQKYASRLPEHQYTPQTSYVGKKIGKAVGYSPILIDKAVTSVFNSYGSIALDIIDYAAKVFGFKERIVNPFDSGWIGDMEKMPFFKAFLVRNDTLNSAPIHELWARYKRVEPYAKSYEFLIKGNEKERAEALKLAKRPEFLIYQKAKESAEAFRNTTNLLHIMANQPNKLFPRLKDESMLDYERRILGQKDAVIQLIIETMIQYAKIENQVLDELEKRLKKMKQ
jgi:hypothetical protein